MAKVSGNNNNNNNFQLAECHHLLLLLKLVKQVAYYTVSVVEMNVDACSFSCACSEVLRDLLFLILCYLLSISLQNH